MDKAERHAHIKPMTDCTDICIVGGGLNGPVLALALAQAGYEVTLVDSGPAPKTRVAFDGRGYAMALASVRGLMRLGLWDDLKKNAQPIEEIKVSDGQAGRGAAPFFMHFEATELGEDAPMGYMIEDRHLRAAAAKALKATSVDVRYDERIAAQTPEAGHIEVSTASGARLNARLLVGCDGRGSGTAQRAGIKRTGWAYNQLGLVCAVAHERPHGAIAHQFFMPGGPLAILPLSGNVSSIVWSEARPRADELAAASDADFLAALRPAFGDFLGDIKLKGQRQSFDLGLSLAQSFVADRVALVGDAAHGIHPIAGQGLNAGIRDIAALTQGLTRAKARGLDPGSATVLKEYSHARRFDATVLAMATDGFNRVFSTANPVMRGLRLAGMGLVNDVAGLRRGFMREASGLSGDLPDLLRP